jgi:hypothetical protein
MNKKFEIKLEIEPSQALRLGKVLEDCAQCLSGGGQEEVDADFMKMLANHLTMFGIAKIAESYMSNSDLFFRDIAAYRLGVVPTPEPTKAGKNGTNGVYHASGVNGAVKVV